jgi:hypothetical protein
VIGRILSFFSPYKLILEIAIIGALAAGAVYEVHQFLEHERDIGRAEKQAAWDEQKKIDKAAALVREAEFKTRLDEAVKNGDAREQIIRNLAAAAGNANLGLRDTLAAIRSSVPGATAETLGKTVATLSSVLSKCTGRYIDVAERADRHASDVKTLEDAFPVSSSAIGKTETH